MTPARILAATAAALSPLIAEEGGTLETAMDLEDAHERLKIGPDRWRVILTAVRGDAIGSTHRTENLTVMAVVQAHKGMSVTVKNKHDGPLMERLEKVRGWISAIRFALPAVSPATVPTFQHPEIDCKGYQRKNWYRLVDPDYPTRQLAAEFTITHAPDPVQALIAPLDVTTIGNPLMLHSGQPVQLHDGQEMQLHTDE